MSEKFVIIALLVIVSKLAVGCKQPTEVTATPEIEKNPTQITNNPPQIKEITASAWKVAVDGRSSLHCEAEDPDGNSLTYSWEASAGTLQSNENSADWYAPSGARQVTVTVTVADGHGGADSKSVSLTTHVNSPMAVLIDATRDGGVWWFPQYEATGFSADAPHQGKAFADFIRSRGFQVDELPRGVTVNDSILNLYDKVIRVGFSGARAIEQQAYDAFLERSTTLVLFSEFLRPGWRDIFAERLGLNFVGSAYGTITKFVAHPITQGITAFDYIAGSVILNPAANPNIEVLGWLSDDTFVDLNGNRSKDADEPTGSAAMGILNHPTAKIFFIGEVNGIERMPQPLVANLIKWAFE